MQHISIIPSTQIDTTKWNACVANNANGLIYANSFYLNHFCKNWFGLVVNNYELIFPIPTKKKLGIQYAYMPAFTQQLGFIGNLNLITTNVVNAIQNFIQYASPYLNFSNVQFAQLHNCHAKNNFILHLNQPYKNIQNGYAKTLGYSLNKANKFSLTYTIETNFAAAINAYSTYNKKNMQHVTDSDYKQLNLLMQYLERHEQVLVRSIANTQNEVLSTVILLKDNKRYYNIINVTNEEGRKKEANYLLYDSLFKELANQEMLFDFEGSDLQGVQKFYEKFGAINQPYFHWHYNLLPKPIKWLKK